jgi:hypothetical protein
VNSVDDRRETIVGRIRRWEADLGPERSARYLGRTRRAAALLLLLGLAGFLIDGANRPANPYLVAAGGAGATTVPAVTTQLPAATGLPAEPSLKGFGTVTLSITPGPGLTGPAQAPCVLQASTPAQQQQGLMNQRTLHGYTGMLFVFAQPVTDRFYMKDTPIPLSIAWFDKSGLFINSTEMPPCPTGTICPTYGAGRPYTMALEVPAGTLGSLGIGPGTQMHAGGNCTIF